MQRRAIFIAVMGLWIMMLGLLLRRTWPSREAPVPAPELVEPALGEEWMGVYFQNQKVGYSHHQLVKQGDGFAFSENSLLRLTVMDAPQVVRTRTQGNTGPDFAVRSVDFELTSGVGNLRAQGIVDGLTLKVTLTTGKDKTEQTLPLSEPVYLPQTFRASLRNAPLQPGRQIGALVFDPTTLKNDRLQMTVEVREAVPGSPSVQAWRVSEEFHGVRTTAWIDEGGTTLREEGPMGMTLIRQSADEAMNAGWADDSAALDLVAKAAVPVTHAIDDARNRMQLRVRLTGIDLDKVPSDDEQVRQDAILTIRRTDLDTLQSYSLPHRGEHSDDLRATPFLQSDHPRVVAQARAILAGESDARRAAMRLNDWVYAHLRKVPTFSIPNALQVLEMGEGDCNEHAVLLAALGRAAGIPTRVIAGTVYLDGAFYYHAWCEMWLGRWVSIDPAFGQFPADATHIKFVIGGPEEHLAMMSIIGRLGIEVLESNHEAATL